MIFYRIEELTKDNPIVISPGETVAITGWGIRYKINPDFPWQVFGLGPMRNKKDAEQYMREHVLRYPEMMGEVITIMKWLHLTEKGEWQERYEEA